MTEIIVALIAAFGGIVVAYISRPKLSDGDRFVDDNDDNGIDIFVVSEPEVEGFVETDGEYGEYSPFDVEPDGEYGEYSPFDIEL
jgi:hypothetical protein